MANHARSQGCRVAPSARARLERGGSEEGGEIRPAPWPSRPPAFEPLERKNLHSLPSSGPARPGKRREPRQPKRASSSPRRTTMGQRRAIIAPGSRRSGAKACGLANGARHWSCGHQVGGGLPTSIQMVSGRPHASTLARPPAARGGDVTNHSAVRPAYWSARPPARMRFAPPHALAGPQQEQRGGAIPAGWPHAVRPAVWLAGAARSAGGSSTPSGR